MMSGLWKNERYVVLRLAIDVSFIRYSPGLMLINETIKYFTKDNHISILDLPYGHEKCKFDMEQKIIIAIVMIFNPFYCADF